MKNVIATFLFVASSSAFAANLSLFCTSGSTQECEIKFKAYLDESGCNFEGGLECAMGSELPWCRAETTYCKSANPFLGGTCSSGYPDYVSVKKGFSVEGSKNFLGMYKKGVFCKR